MNPPLLTRECSQFVLIDAQEHLAAAMAAESLRAMERSCAILLQACRLLAVPVLFTEQYPKGLGPTLDSLRFWLDSPPLEKTCFSCCRLPAFSDCLDPKRNQIVLAGMEAHICVLQTALDLQAQGRLVFVVEDAVLSRNAAHHANAMQRLRQAGVIVTNTESVVFEWLGAAEGEAFKQLSRLLR